MAIFLMSRNLNSARSEQILRVLVKRSFTCFTTMRHYDREFENHEFMNSRIFTKLLTGFVCLIANILSFLWISKKNRPNRCCVIFFFIALIPANRLGIGVIHTCIIRQQLAQFSDWLICPRHKIFQWKFYFMFKFNKLTFNLF